MKGIDYAYVMTRAHEVETRHLAALRAVADEGSFGRAAARLGYSQAAVSQQIAGLERTVGQPVFDRPGGARPAELTPAGRLLLDHAVRVLDRLDRALDELDRLRAGTGGRLVVGTFQSASVRLLPAVVRRMLAEAPELDIRLDESDSNEVLVDGVAAGELDVSFLVAPVLDERVTTVVLCRDPFVLMLPAEDDVPGGEYPLHLLEGRPMVGQRANLYEALVDDRLRAVGVDPRYVFRANDNGSVQAMVRAGMGPAILPRLAVDLDDPGVQFRDLEPTVPPRTLLLGRRRDRTSLPAADRFVELALESVAESGL